MEFAVYYDVTAYFNNLIKSKPLLGVGNIYENGYYICGDVNDFQIARIQVGINSEYEAEERTKIVERQLISKGEFNDYVIANRFIGNDEINMIEIKMIENMKKKSKVPSDVIIQMITNEIVEVLGLEKSMATLIKMDTENGFENYDVVEFRFDVGLEEIVESIDDGFGIIKLQEEVTENGLALFVK